jgi:alkanesulfonate monooxygenase SsuD/methylene tetrahydromethanopterin reductase-like flavin-dependent oxidoreductase (luciferase family)
MMKRIGQLADGWIMLEHPVGPQAEAAFKIVRDHASDAGRNPADIGIEVWVSPADGRPADWRAEIEGWKALGVTHVCVNNVYNRMHHNRIEGRTLGAHVEAIQRYHDAVADVL